MRYLSQKRESAGISSTQGGHHVAQKCTMKILPFCFARSVFLPAWSKMGSSGAADRNCSEPDGDSGGTSDLIQTMPTRREDDGEA